MEPASSIIAKLGGEREVAAATGTSYTAPYRWQHPVDKGGTGGRVPSKHIPVLIEMAKARGIALSTDEFFGTTSLAEAS